MKPSLDWSELQRTRWQDYALRFVFGGTATVLAGWLAQRFGPAFGGLFLAFPAIFPASATLIEKHEREKKCRHGLNAPIRGRKAAAIDAAGAVLGALALIGFALIVWQGLPRHSAAVILATAAISWLVLGMALWWLRQQQRVLRRLRRRGRHD